MGYPSVFGGQWVAANFAFGSPGGPAGFVVRFPESHPGFPAGCSSRWS